MDRRDRMGTRPHVSPRAPGGRPDRSGRVPGDRGLPPRQPDGTRSAPQPLITPLRTTLALALLIGIALLAYALFVQRGQNIPFLAAACAVLGVAFAAIAVTGAVATYRSAAEGRGGRAFGLAFVGGIAAVGAFGFLALATIFGLLWTAPT